MFKYSTTLELENVNLIIKVVFLQSRGNLIDQRDLPREDGLGLCGHDQQRKVHDSISALNHNPGWIQAPLKPIMA